MATITITADAAAAAVSGPAAQLLMVSLNDLLQKIRSCPVSAERFSSITPHLIAMAVTFVLALVSSYRSFGGRHIRSVVGLTK